jgi:DNA-binding GntR family transcriptional regulator
MEPLLKADDTDTFTQHHRLIIKALKRQDVAAVRDYMIDDIKTTHVLLQTLVSGDSRPTSDG